MAKLRKAKPNKTSREGPATAGRCGYVAPSVATADPIVQLESALAHVPSAPIVLQQAGQRTTPAARFRRPELAAARPHRGRRKDRPTTPLPEERGTRRVGWPAVTGAGVDVTVAVATELATASFPWAQKRVAATYSALMQYDRARPGGQMRFWLDLLIALVVAGVGVIAALIGEVDDAPGLVGIGCLLVAGAVGLGVRTGRRSAGNRATTGTR